ncbi:MAG: RnfH family protein [Gammaproteobacteria bacterium]|nr:RnfH family protein [Gammaproteobacteria bacterium]MBU0788664.1 RnfH family protein [Gammaproteobacteria bacterium]MBU0814717.1 RnfH family protein [Gammaproteobacteria bacterium]MBU1786440.1 RnfH family protein [Gammaproteobacteria bacterium]
MAITVNVLYSPGPRLVEEMQVELTSSARVMDALQASGLLLRHPELDVSQLSVGIWGRKAGLRQLLRDRDRVEVYRPLKVDPKVARRERFVKQGARTTGLFAKKRAGAKAGY